MFGSKNEKIQELEMAILRLEERVERTMNNLANLQANFNNRRMEIDYEKQEIRGAFRAEYMDFVDRIIALEKKAQSKEKDEKKVWVVDHNDFNELTAIWPASLEKGYHYLIGDKVVQVWAVGNEHSIGIDVKNDKYIYFENSRVDGFILTQKINILKGVPVA